MRRRSPRGAPINRCPPGAGALIATLAAITGRPAIAFDRSCGEPDALTVARIDEAVCIGCTLCIDACPVDAIVGAAKRMHTVLPALCTGCELCVAPCPVDCIAMIPAGRAWSEADAAKPPAIGMPHETAVLPPRQGGRPSLCCTTPNGRSVRRPSRRRSCARRRRRAAARTDTK